MEYSYLLHKASEATDPVERMQVRTYKFCSIVYLSGILFRPSTIT